MSYGIFQAKRHVWRGLLIAAAGMAAAWAEASGEVVGLTELLDRAAIPSESKGALTRDIRTLGAVDVTELTRQDWASLASWATLREMERRRILRFVPP